VLAVEHEPGEVSLQRVPVLLQEALHVVRHRAGKMFDPAKESTFENLKSFQQCCGSRIQDLLLFNPWILDPGSVVIIADYISESLCYKFLG
jgi:hypothetical protein